MKNINYIILNTGFTKKYEDDTAKVEENREYINKMVGSIKNEHYMELSDNTMINCETGVNNKFYLATLWGIDKQLIPLLLTAGAADENGAKIVCDLFELFLKKCFLIEAESAIVRPEPPFICDIVLPTSIFRRDVMTWSAKFSVCFGFGMLRMLSDRK